MKSQLLIVFALFSCFLLRGQSPTFSPIGTKWGYSYQHTFGHGKYVKEAIADTLINGRICRKFNTINYDTYFNKIYTGSAFIAQSRDSIFQVEPTTGSLSFLYHFHCQVGDTLKPAGCCSSLSLGYLCTRTSDTLIGGVNLKKWQFKQLCTAHPFDTTSRPFNHILLEKIGVLNMPFQFVSTCYIDYSDYIMCSFKDANINIQSTGCVTATNETNGSDALSISPNPTHSVLNIASNQPFSTYKIIDLTGKTLEMRSYTEGGQIDVSNLKSGIYLLKMTDKNGQISIKRFVKL
jgi:hypothetical protein